MEIKVEVDTERAAKVTVADDTSYCLCRVAECLDNLKIAIINTIMIVIVIVILYEPQSVAKKTSL